METETIQEEKYLKVAATPNKGDKATVKLRLLDYPGVELFRHWIGEGDAKYPFNCPGPRAGCPACRERSLAKLAGEDHRVIHRMEHRRVMNVLDITDKDNPKLKIFYMGPAIEKQLKGNIDRGEEDGVSFTDPTAYDIKIVKTKGGDAKFDVDYYVQYVAHRDLTPVEKALADQKYDLSPETTPATNQTISDAIAGVKPVAQLASAEQRRDVEKILKRENLDYIDLKITNPEALTSVQAVKILGELG